MSTPEPNYDAFGDGSLQLPARAVCVQGVGAGSCEVARTVATDDILAGVAKVRIGKKTRNNDGMRQLYGTTETG